MNTYEVENLTGKKFQFDAYKYTSSRNRDDIIIRFSIFLYDKLPELKSFTFYGNNIVIEKTDVKKVSVEEYFFNILNIYTDIMLTRFPDYIKNNVITSMVSRSSFDLSLLNSEMLQDVLKDHERNTVNCYEVEKVLCLCCCYFCDRDLLLSTRDSYDMELVRNLKNNK